MSNPARNRGVRSRFELTLVLVLAWLAPFLSPAHACTIFVLTDTHRALFFNNEDWSNPASRIRFVPAGDGYLGCAYVGFDNGWAQGGMNTAGLAFDWVAGFLSPWKPTEGMKAIRGNPSERMLETCATVDDAVRFYRTHWEPDFARARILVADRTGASVIIGAKDGQVQVEKSTQCRGFGFGRSTLNQRLAQPPEATIANGRAILRACLQQGEFPTRYSNVYDLRTGDIFLFPDPARDEEFRLNLAAELARGAHYFELPNIREQQSEPIRPLPPHMRRFYLDEFKPIPDPDPATTRRLEDLLEAAQNGRLQSDDFTAALWGKLSPARAEMQSELTGMGKLLSLILVDRHDDNGQRVYRYLVDFANARILQRFTLTPGGKIALLQPEGFEKKPELPAAAD